MAGAAHLSRAALPAGALESETLDALPGKERLLKRSFRPPNYETPLSDLNDAITPNNRFFVRWHLANIPTVAADSWRLTIGGNAASGPLELTLNQLKTESSRSSSSPCANARETGAGWWSRTFPASNGPTARWAMRAGKARGSKTSSLARA